MSKKKIKIHEKETKFCVSINRELVDFLVMFSWSSQKQKFLSDGISSTDSAGRGLLLDIEPKYYVEIVGEAKRFLKEKGFKAA